MLVSPWYSFHLSLWQKWSIWRTPNPWDRDVLTKHALGLPADVFARPGQWFHPQPILTNGLPDARAMFYRTLLLP
jgi:hypothetical protein